MSINTKTSLMGNASDDQPRSGLGFLKESWRTYLFLFIAIAVMGKTISESSDQELWSQQIRNLVSFFALSGVTVVSLFRPKIPFFILILYLPFSEKYPGRFGGAIQALNIFNVLFLITVGAMIVEAIKGKMRIFVGNPLTKIVALLCLLSIANYAVGSFQKGTAYSSAFVFVLKRWLDPFLLFFLASSFSAKRSDRREYLIAIMLGVAMVGFLSIKDFGGQTHFHYDRRLTGVAKQSNILAAFCVDYMFIFLGILFVNFRKKIYWFITVPFWNCLRTILFTFSRGGYVGFVVSALLITFIKGKKIFFLAVVLFGIVFMNQQLFLPQAVVERIESTKTDKVDTYTDDKQLERSAEHRLEAWRACFELAKEKPFFGYGFGAVAQFLTYYAGIELGDVHNTYLLLAIEHGGIWLLIFLAAIFAGMSKMYYIFKHSKDDIIQGAALGFLAGTAGFLTVNFFGSHLSTLNEVAYFWILMAIMANEERDLREEQTLISTVA